MRLKHKIPKTLNIIIDLIKDNNKIQQDILLSLINRNYPNNQHITKKQLYFILKSFKYKRYKDGIIEFNIK